MDGNIFTCWLVNGAGGSSKFSDIPYVIVWDLVNITPTDLHQMPPDHVIQILKQALTVFGYAGARGQIDNTVVNVNCCAFDAPAATDQSRL